MHRFRNLNRYGQILLLIMAVMVVVFAVVYPVTISREGYLYDGQLLFSTTENGSTVYSAEVKGQQWRITVTADKAVTFRFGDKQYGPYTAKEDSTAIPVNHDLSARMTGVEIRESDEIFFRGGICDIGPYQYIVQEDGTDLTFQITVSSDSGTVIDSDGNVIDTMKPSVGTILRLMQGPELTHRGHGAYWFLGTLFALFATVSILFADELFRLHYIFKVQDPDLIEPSDWVLAMRPIAWFILVVMVFALYMMGLK